MKPNETLVDFTLHILDKSRKLELEDSQVMQIFIQGLTDNLKEHVLLQDPRN